jgi:hypothetical protein
MCIQVLAREFGAVRHCREKQLQDQQGATPAALAAATEAGTGTLAANTMTLLRHAFILIAGECLPCNTLPAGCNTSPYCGNCDSCQQCSVQLQVGAQQSVLLQCESSPSANPLQNASYQAVSFAMTSVDTSALC